MARVCGASAFIVPGGLGLGDATLGGLVALPLGYLGWGVPILGFVAAYLVSGVVALVGLATRRLTLRSHIAFGPVMSSGALGRRCCVRFTARLAARTASADAVSACVAGFAHAALVDRR